MSSANPMSLSAIRNLLNILAAAIKHFPMLSLDKQLAGLSRLAYQWEKSVNNAIDAMRIQATSYMHEELATIEALLSRTQGQTNDIKRVITRIEKLSGTLSE